MRASVQAARVALVCLALGLLLGVALTATNDVPASSVDSLVAGRPTANQLKPPECAALDLEAVIIVDSVRERGRDGLVLGTSGPDVLRGQGGSDCLVGGAGNDHLRGEGGYDVCVGGPGVDTFHVTCEVRIQ